MSIEEIDLISFRNHDQQTLEFDRTGNVIWGANGVGKTAVLEAIYLLSMGKSFRTSNQQELIRNGEESLHLAGTFLNEEHETQIALNQTRRGQRKILINGKAIRGRKELIGKNPVVLLSPEEHYVTKGTPGDIRQYFDRVFSVVSNKYVYTLSDYMRGLKQRNAALTLVKERKEGPQAASAWDDILIESGTEIWDLRKELFKVFQEQMALVIAEYGDEEVRLKAQYKEHLSTDEDGYREALTKTLRRDIYVGRTTTGPHRDEYTFEFQEKNLKKFGSQGEHKIALVLIKLAELHTIKALTGITPIFLLDDLFAKLDTARSRKVLSLLEADVQKIITTTDLTSLETIGIHMDSTEYKDFFLEA